MSLYPDEDGDRANAEMRALIPKDAEPGKKFYFCWEEREGRRPRAIRGTRDEHDFVMVVGEKITEYPR